MSVKSNFRAKIVQAIKPKFARTSELNSSPSLILDVGIANDSYRECKSIFPDARYHGLDFLEPDFKFDTDDLFIKCNLELPDALNSLESRYDLIIANHVLEHLPNGDVVFAKLCDLLAPGGQFYAEFPSLKTARHAKKSWRYHFHDDPTHCRVYRLEDLANLAFGQGCKLVSCGPASTAMKDVLSVPRALVAVVRGQPWGPYLQHFLRRIDHIHVRRLR